MSAYKKRKSFLICIAETRTIKAGRDRISGILRYAARHDNWQIRLASEHLLAHTANESDNTSAPDGIIGYVGIINLQKPQPKKGTAIIYIDANVISQDGQYANVSIDNDAIGRAAAEMFLKKGLRAIGFVGTGIPNEISHQNERLKSLESCAKDAGASFYTFIPDISTTNSDDLEELSKWLEELPHPCGVMAYCDSRAQQVIDACHMAHLKIPDQIQVIGVDNEVEICENMQPTLTSILPDFEGGGYLAARLMEEALSRRRPRKSPKMVSYGVKAVVERASTQDIRGGGRIVMLAKEFIRKNANKEISVSNIADSLNVSRRTIERHFREITGDGVAAALRTERLARVQRLLKETDRTISDISYDSGFASATYLKALFKKTYHMTMGEWRIAARR